MAVSKLSQITPAAPGATSDQIVGVKSGTTDALYSVEQILDTFGSTQGDILYRGASNWTVLAPGTSGNFLKTQGAAANPTWAAISASLVNNSSTITGGTKSFTLYDSGGTLTEALEVFNAQVYGWLPDGTDRSTQALALLAAVSAAGGGTIYFPPSSGTYRADSQLLIPNDSASPQPHQVNFRLTGAGGGPNWYTITSGSINASVLDLRYHGSGAKLTSLGLGSITIDNLTFTDGSAVNGTPFFLTTNTTSSIHDNNFSGGGATSHTVTFSGANITWNSHPFQINNMVMFTNSGGSLPTGLSLGKIYYVVAITTNTFQVAPGPDATTVITTSGGSGTTTAWFPGQDAIVLGGADPAIGAVVTSPFQGYGTNIQNNVFTNMNRGIFGLNFANSITILGNSWVHNTGFCAIDSNPSAASTGLQRNVAWTIVGNIFEMDIYIYGVNFAGTGFCVLNNSFFDPGVAALACYNLSACTGTSNATLSSFNSMETNYNSSGNIVLNTTNDAATNATGSALFGAATFAPLDGNTGLISAWFPRGLIVPGRPDYTNQYPGPFTAIDFAGGNNQMSFGFDNVNSYGMVDCYNLASALPRALNLNPRGGAVQIGAEPFNTQTSNYGVLTTDSSCNLNNSGASGAVNFTLPSGPISFNPIFGLTTYIFTVVAAQAVTITAGNGSTHINVGGVVSAAGGNITSSTVGSSIRLTCTEGNPSTGWIAEYVTGSWVVN